MYDYKPLTFSEFEAFFQPLMERADDEEVLIESDNFTPLTIDDLDHLLEASV